jgi:hypothetical protein
VTAGGWSLSDFETKLDDGHTFPFYEDESGDWIIGHGHHDKDRFAVLVNEYDKLCGYELDEDDQHYEGDVRHYYAIPVDGRPDYLTWRHDDGPVTKDMPGAMPLTVIMR